MFLKPLLCKEGGFFYVVQLSFYLNFYIGHNLNGCNMTQAVLGYTHVSKKHLNKIQSPLDKLEF